MFFERTRSLALSFGPAGLVGLAGLVAIFLAGPFGESDDKENNADDLD